MATADELLNSSTETIDEILVIDLDTRIISIPASISILGVASDDDVKCLQFKVPRYYGDNDLSEFSITINFMNAAIKGDLYPVNDQTISDEDDTMTFSWLIDRTAFEIEGDVLFSVCMKKLDKDGVVVKELNTAIAKLPVLPGLETSKAVVENNPSAFDAVLWRLYAVEAATGLGQTGYYTFVTVEDSEEGVVFTLTNSEGTIRKTVRHGVDAYTPVKGVDYWTEEEQLEIKNTTFAQTKDYIDKWAPFTATATLRAYSWTDYKQSVKVTGVSKTSIVFVAPEPSSENFTNYTEQNVRCIDQDVDELIFECSTVPTIDLVANVAIYYSTADVNPIGLIVSDDDEGNVYIS